MGTAWIGGALALAGGANLFQNGDVEAANGRSPKAWSHTGGAGVVFERREAERGHALVIANDTAGERTPHNWRQLVVLPAKEKPARLELRARVKAPRLDPAGSACVMVQCLAADGRAIAFAWADEVEGAPAEWRDTSAVFDVPAECTQVHVLAYLVGAGEAWFDDFELEATDKPPRSSDGRAPDPDLRMQALARGAAGGLPWRFDVEEARAAAQREGRPLLVYVRCIDDDAQLAAAQRDLAMAGVGFHDDGLRKDVLFRAGPLSDPEVAALVATRFVPLVVTYDLSKHGMGPSADDPLAPLKLRAHELVTPALVVLEPRGDVVHALHRIGVLHAPSVERMLRAALEKARAKRPGEVDAKSAAALAAAGELDAAAKLLQGRSEPAAKALLAAILRRRGDLPGAQKVLGSAPGDEAALERGRQASARGDWEAALAAFGKVGAEAAAELREAAAWGGAFALDRLGRHDEAAARLRGLAGESALGRRAAACLLADGPNLLLAENPVEVADVPELLPATEGLPEVPQFDGARSLRALLDLQRSDGSFIGHMRLWDASITAFALDAIDAWSAKLPAAGKARAKAARERALQWLVQWSGGPPNPATDPFHAPYVLLTLARAGEQAAVAKLVERILGQQQADGNWTVYGADRPASFNTALAVRALCAAKELGVAVEEAKLGEALDALEEMRKGGDLWCYSTKPGHEWMTTKHGSIARDCLCEGALLAGGRKAAPRLGPALDRFLETHHELREPTKRLYDYFNGRGHGGYFYFFAHWHAAEAAQHLPAARRKKVLAAIRDELLSCRELDGTWLDHALLGRAYGTAQALKILALD